MADDDVSVQKLVFVNLKFEQPIAVELPPWDQLTPAVQDGLERLDTNNDGQIVVDTGVSSFKNYTYQYSSEGGDSLTQAREYKVEVGNLDGSQQAFFRYFWAYRGDNPYNNATKDQATWQARIEGVRRVQQQVIAQVIPNILLDPGNPIAWEEVGLVLETLADGGDLFWYASKKLYPTWQKTKDRRFLELTEHFLLEARRLTAPSREGRLHWSGKISAALEQVGKELDTMERAEYEAAKRNPYLINNRGAPYTVEGSERTLVFRVSTRANRPTGLVEYFTENPLFLLPSRFKGKVSDRQPIRLVPVGVVSQMDLAHTTYRDQAGLSRVVFEEKERSEFLLAFRLPDGVSVGSLREGLKARSWDVIQQGKSGQAIHQVRGGVVFQDTVGKTIRIAMASDLHIAERDYLVLDTFLREYEQDRQRERKGELSPTEFLDVKQRYQARINRFFASINESVEAMIAIWNERYRQGTLDQVFLTGDLADFINITPRMRKLGLHGTNLARLEHILSKLEAPLYFVWGNHDEHIVQYALSFRKEYFSQDREIYRGISKVDRSFLGTEDPARLALLSTKGLLTTYCDDDDPSIDCALDAGRRLMQANLNRVPSDGLQQHCLNFHCNEAFVTTVQGRPDSGRRYFYNARTRVEDFAVKRYGKQDVPAPVLRNYFKDGVGNYLGKMASNGLGPLEEVAGDFIRFVREVKKQQGRVTFLSHYPMFNGGVGPGGSPSTVDTNREDVAWLFRIVCYLERYALEQDGREGPVVDMVIAGHTHRSATFSFEFNFPSPEQETAFLIEGRQILDEGAQNPVGIYQKVEALAKKYELDKHIAIPGSKDPDANDDPSKTIARLRQFNQDSHGFVKKNGTFFINLPAAGPPASDSPPGFMEMTLHPDGGVTLLPYFVHLAPDGRVIQGHNLKHVLGEKERLNSVWRRSLVLPTLEAGSQPFRAVQRAIPIKGDPEVLPDSGSPDSGSPGAGLPDYEKTDGRGREPSVDSPWITNKVAWWALQTGWLGGLDPFSGKGRSIWEVVQLSIPVSDYYKPIGLNAVLVGVDYGMGRWFVDGGVDLGLVHLHGQIDPVAAEILGVGASIQSFLPFLHLPAVQYFYNRVSLEHQLTLGVKLEFTPFSWKFD